MSNFFLTEGVFREFLTRLDKSLLYGTTVEEERLVFGAVAADQIDKLTVRCARPATSVRSVMLPAKERVAVYPAKDVPWELEISPDKPAVLVGIRGCELRVLEVQDWVFLEGDFVDPFYQARRDALVIIGTDCVAFAPSCFCTLLGEQPYPTSNFDLVLSPLAEGYVLGTGSPRGEEIAARHLQDVSEPTPQQLEERERTRKEVAEKLVEQNKEFDIGRSREELARLVRETIESKGWNPTLARCVECGACTHICPGCFCFYLYDQPSELVEQAHERVRAWDSCMFADYSRMAGAGGVKANPRAAFRTRFQNRFLHKFVWNWEAIEKFSCVGCGRCFDACAGGIDVREVLKDLAQ